MTDQNNSKADIIQYSSQYGSVICSWIDTAETYRDVCRGKDFPPPEDIVDSWQRKDVSSFILLRDKKPVAYAEIWNRTLEISYEFSHLIVDPTLRGEGYGTKLMKLLVQQTAAKRDVAKLTVTVYGDNKAALGCYLNAGFELVGTTTYTEGLKLVQLIE